MKTVMFVCTGNYYRSRFSEILFNKIAIEEGLNWKAISRGYKADNPKNVGFISRHCLEGLSQRGISHIADRLPMRMSLCDLQSSDLIIALKKDEHYSMTVQLFPEWIEKITFWQIHDIDVQEPEGALKELEHKLLTLVGELKNLEFRPC